MEMFRSPILSDIHGSQDFFHCTYDIVAGVMECAPEIVIGIDFGTTFSGVSWAVNGGNKAIRLITNWPNPQGGRNRNSDKTPSAIAYEHGNPTKWGYEVDDRDQSFRWIKILLEPESEYSGKSEQVKKSNELLNQLNRQAISVVADYLRKLWEYSLKEIEKKQGAGFRDDYRIKVIMSVPAMWTPKAKERTRQAAEQAGLGREISFVTEPEAAALATLKESESAEVKPGDCFVVCDAGGGTVDLISYEVQRIDPLVIKECAIGTGGLCGSAYLDMGFQKWVCQKIGEAQWSRIKSAAKRRMINDFENAIKRSFDPATKKEYAVDLRGVEDDPSAGIRDDTITVKSTVILTIFDQICLQIKQLVAQQIQQVKGKGMKVKAILLVGGFGESGYLYDQLKAAHGSDNIAILQVHGGWSAVCRGATMWGLEQSDHSSQVQKTVAARLARYSYGIKLDEPFNNSKHNVSERVWNVAQQRWNAKDQMQWLVQKGQEFVDGQLVRMPAQEQVEGIGRWSGFFSDDKREFEISLWYTEEYPPPQSGRSKGIKKLRDLTWSLDEFEIWNMSRSYKVSGKRYRNIKLNIDILMHSVGLIFTVSYAGELRAMSSAEYPD